MALMACVGCGGSADDGNAGNGGAAGSGGNAGSAASGGSGASGGNAGSGASGGSAGSGASGGNAGTGNGGSGGDSFTHCAVPSDCVLMPASCCGSCGAYTREDIQAVNKDIEDYARGLVCGEDEGCALCYTPSDANLVATCTAGKCQVVDLLTSPATECQVHSDCRLRSNECCECGGSQDVEHLVAVSNSAPLESAVCDPELGCPECEPGDPMGVEAQCQAGRCVVQWLLGN